MKINVPPSALIATVFLGSFLHSHGADGQAQIKLVDGNGRPVACAVYRMEPDATLKSVGHNDNNTGLITVSDGCSAGCKFFFYPDDAGIYYRDSTDCPLTMNSFTMKEIRNRAVQRLGQQLPASQGQTASAQESARAALINNEIADKVTAPSIKRAYELQAAIDIGTALNVSKPLVHDAGQKRVVVSPDLEEGLKKFQTARQLTPSGQVNFPTLRAASGTTATALLK